MKRINNLLPQITNLDNLYLAFWKASKGKRYAKNVLEYQSNLHENLQILRQTIESGKVEVGNYKIFKIFDPKERTIAAPAFEEQVLHHALMNVCHPYFEAYQIHDSYASRKNKGIYKAIDRAKYYSQKYTCFLKLDIKNFFGSIHHEVLKTQLKRKFKEEKLLSIFYQIIDSFEQQPNRGVPIGNLTSQYFANHFLGSLDHFVQRTLKCKAYVRYMDDIVIWSNNKNELKAIRNEIRDFVEQELKGTLKPELINYSDRGLPFLGYKIFPNKLLLTQRSKQRYIKKLRFIENQYHEGVWDETTCQQRILPLLAFINHANTENLKKSVFLNLKR
jgi:hypothetical protein